MCKSNRNDSYDYYILQIEAAKKRFMSENSHELRKPVRKSLSSDQLRKFTDKQSSEEKMLKYLGAIEKVALDLMRLNQQDF